MWDDSGFEDYDYSGISDQEGANFWDQEQAGMEGMQSGNWDSSNFWDQENMFANVPSFGGDFETPMSNYNGAQSYAPGSAMFNMLEQSNPEMSMPQTYGAGDMGGGWSTSGIQDTLSKLFSGAAGNKGLMTGLGALMEGYQNKKNASSTNKLAQQQQQRMDPFGPQRPQYQQLLSQAVKDPYSAPIVRDQVAQIQKAQAIKDAAAGRRSNQATSNPAMLAAQAQVAQEYIKSLYTPAGANIGPQDGGSLEAMLQANKSNTNGYISPIMSALGMNSQTNSNSTAMAEALQKLLAGAR